MIMYFQTVLKPILYRGTRMTKPEKQLSPAEAKSFLEWARREKLLVSTEARRRITKEVKALFDQGSITKEEFEQYKALTKASIREK